MGKLLKKRKIEEVYEEKQKLEQMGDDFETIYRETEETDGKKDKKEEKGDIKPENFGKKILKQEKC